MMQLFRPRALRKTMHFPNSITQKRYFLCNLTIGLLQDLFCPKHTFSPKDLNIYHWYFEKSEKQGFRLNFVSNSHFMNIITIAHSSVVNNFSIAIASKREHILKIPMLAIWIFRLRCAVDPTNYSWVRKI